MVEKLRKHWSTEKFGGKVFRLADTTSDDLPKAKQIAAKWRAKGYNARVVKGHGVWGSRYTYAIYVRKAEKRLSKGGK